MSDFPLFQSCRTARAVQTGNAVLHRMFHRSAAFSWQCVVQAADASPASPVRLPKKRKETRKDGPASVSTLPCSVSASSWLLKASIRCSPICPPRSASSHASGASPQVLVTSRQTSPVSVS